MAATTAIHEVIEAIITALRAAMSSTPIYDGAPVTRLGSFGEPSATAYLIVAGSLDPDEDAFGSVSEWHGNRSKIETLDIHCVAVGRDTHSSVSAARALAAGVIEDVGSHLPIKPTEDSYNALVSNIDSGRVTAVGQTGAKVEIAFTITVKALVPRT